METIIIIGVVGLIFMVMLLAIQIEKAMRALTEWMRLQEETNRLIAKHIAGQGGHR